MSVSALSAVVRPVRASASDQTVRPFSTRSASSSPLEIAGDDGVERDRRRGGAEQAGHLDRALDAPQRIALVPRQREQLVVGRQHVEPPVRHRRGPAQRQPEFLAPDRRAGRRIEGDDDAEAGRRIDLAVARADPAAERDVGLLAQRDPLRPDPVSGRHVERRDVAVGVHREDPAAGDDRRGVEPALPGRALADLGAPRDRQRVGQREVAAVLRRIAAGLRPVGVDRRRRQDDRQRLQFGLSLGLGLEVEDRHARPGRRGLGLALEGVAAAQRERGRGRQQDRRTHHWAIPERDCGPSRVAGSAPRPIASWPARLRRLGGALASRTIATSSGAARSRWPSLSSATAVISPATANHGSPGTANGLSRAMTVAGGSASNSSRVALIVARSRNGVASDVSAAIAR